jgi:bacterioferritin (cytochrome b1)
VPRQRRVLRLPAAQRRLTPEDHLNWLEAQLALVERVGLQNYLAEQIKHDGD